MKVNGPKTFTAGEDLAEKRLVKQSAAGIAVYADALSTDDAIGINDYAVLNNELCAVDLAGGSDTREFTAAGAIAAGAKFFQADNGMVQALPAAAGTYRNVGIALEAAAGADVIFEGMFYRFGDSTTVV